MPASKKSKIKTKDPEAEVKQEPVKETPVEPAVRPAMIIEPAVEEKPAEAVPVEPTVADLASVSTNEEKSDVESEPRVEKRSGRGILWMALAFILGTGVGLGTGFLVWKGGIGKKTAPVAAVVKTEPTAAAPSPTVTQNETEDRSIFKIQVLNGSGVKGAAATAKDYLESMGYTGVETGNAEGDNYSQTAIEVKAGQEKLFAILKADLGAKYTVDAVMGTLSASSTFDGVVIIGKK